MPKRIRVIHGKRYQIGTGADLTGADLSGADLTGLSLCGANLTNANLCGANLRYVDISFATLDGADLTGADLHCTLVYRVDLMRANNVDKALNVGTVRFIREY